MTEAGVLGLPGSYFGPGLDGYLRLAFANVERDILAGLGEQALGPEALNLQHEDPLFAIAQNPKRRLLEKAVLRMRNHARPKTMMTLKAPCCARQSYDR